MALIRFRWGDDTLRDAPAERALSGKVDSHAAFGCLLYCLLLMGLAGLIVSLCQYETVDRCGLTVYFTQPINNDYKMLTFFAKYLTVGVVNTLIHWVTFFICISQGLLQSTANVIAFGLAVTFSFFVNARWTFNQQATPFRYILYVIFMGAMAFCVGYLADRIGLYPIVTLITSSALSLACGFIFSHFIVFKGNK